MGVVPISIRGPRDSRPGSSPMDLPPLLVHMVEVGSRSTRKGRLAQGLTLPTYHGVWGVQTKVRKIQ
jgi:hypothetical protein